MTDITQSSLVVEWQGETFTFRIPTLRDDARMDSYIKALILQDTQNPEIKESQLDDVTKVNYRVIAAFGVLLQKSSALWPWRENPQTRIPEVNVETLPAKAVEIYVKFAEALNMHFRDATAVGQSPTEQPVVSGASPAS